jgi:hypothetical protein
MSAVTGSGVDVALREIEKLLAANIHKDNSTELP